MRQHENHSRLVAFWRKLIPERRDALLNDAAAPTAGNPNGDVPLVLFLDYNCPRCRAEDRTIQQALKHDPMLKVVYKHCPGKRPGSKFAALAALASSKQGKYEAFHHALMAARGQLSQFDILTIARHVGLEVEQLKRDMEDRAIESVLERNCALAKELYINVTPALVLGDEVISGVLKIHTLERFIAKEREEAKRRAGSQLRHFDSVAAGAIPFFGHECRFSRRAKSLIWPGNAVLACKVLHSARFPQLGRTRSHSSGSIQPVLVFPFRHRRLSPKPRQKIGGRRADACFRSRPARR
ncbi:DsbA family protein [Mesorhizobium sp.]|uniref:DsbA family protein n=1 Tax=Mesorhizobium sp. TaxID=1871066 RepID=UPI0025800CF3|nr:DsbA family protein [Mesorhizobium sp.]